MHFLQLIRNELCHPDDVVLQSGPSLHCNRCQRSVDLYAYVQQPFDHHFRSSELAQAYFEWTGDDQVPLSFTIVDLEGILPQRVQGQALRHVRQCIDMLRALNSPFTTEPSRPPCDTGAFFKNYLGLLSRQRGPFSSSASTPVDPTQAPSSSSVDPTQGSSSDDPAQAPSDDHIGYMLQHLMKAMDQLVQSEEFANPFEYYFEKLAPFVQQSVPEWKPLLAAPEDPNLAKELLIQLQRSSAIRRTFGLFSIPFDILHVMLGCYASSSDWNLVANWAFDFMARVCRGHYFWKQYPSSPFVTAMQRFLKREITYKKRIHLYHVLREIERGHAAEGLSAFWTHYVEMQVLVRDKFHVPKVAPDILGVAASQTFPAVLFDDPGDHLGFTIGLGYIVMKANLKKGIVPKGCFKKARATHETVMRFVHKVRDFDSISNYWTMDTVRLFFTSAPDMEKEISKIVQLLYAEEE